MKMRAWQLVLLGVGLCGCSAQSGALCRSDTDCRPGLLCSRAPGVGAGGHGVCEPALRGTGETCLVTAECQPPLICSTELGELGGDGRHGACRPPQDLGLTLDLGSLPGDAAPTDGAAPDAAVDSGGGDGPGVSDGGERG